MTTTPAMPELPEPRTLSRGDEDGPIQLGYTADQMRAYALATLQAQPAAKCDGNHGGPRCADPECWNDDPQAHPAAEVSDDDLQAIDDAHNWQTLKGRMAAYRAILALRPQFDGAGAPTIEAAREMGAKGGPVVEAERLAFEAWMAGHCWKVSPTWNGQTYDDSEEDKNRGLLDPLARTTRMLWAAWRDRAALRPAQQSAQQAVPMTDEQVFHVENNHPDSMRMCALSFRLGIRAAEAHHRIGITAQGAQEGV